MNPSLTKAIRESDPLFEIIEGIMEYEGYTDIRSTRSFLRFNAKYVRFQYNPDEADFFLPQSENHDNSKISQRARNYYHYGHKHQGISENLETY